MTRFSDLLQTYTIEKHSDKEYRKFFAFIHSANDPTRRGRVRLHIPELFGTKESDYTDWVPVRAFSGGLDCGSMVTPEKNDKGIAIVSFIHGNNQYPIVEGFIINGDLHDPNGPEESKELCDGQGCIDCVEKDLLPIDLKEHKKYHNHTNEFYCPKIKTLYKSPKGAALILGDRGEKEFLRFIDQTGQVLEFSCPVKKEKTRKRGLNNALNGDQFDTEEDIIDDGAYIKLMDLANQMMHFQSKFGEELICFLNRNKEGDSSHKVLMTVKENEEEYSITQDIKGRIQSLVFDGRKNLESIKLTGKCGNYLLISSKPGLEVNTFYSKRDTEIMSDRKHFFISSDDTLIESGTKIDIIAPSINLQGNVFLSGYGGVGGNFTWSYNWRKETAQSYIESVSNGSYELRSGSTFDIVSGTNLSIDAGANYNISCGDKFEVSSPIINLNGQVYVNGHQLIYGHNSW